MSGLSLPESGYWQVLCGQPYVGICVVASNGIVLFANKEASWLFFRDADFRFDGKALKELFGEQYAQERRLLIQRVIAEDGPVLVDQISSGRRTRSLLWPGEDLELGNDVILAVTYRSPPESRRATVYPVYESRFVDWGPLDVLSDRELEVLALLGHGWTLKRAATGLKLSVKTVEKYRTSIGHKLRLTSIAALAAVAHNAGLETRHASYPRVKLPVCPARCDVDELKALLDQSPAGHPPYVEGGATRRSSPRELQSGTTRRGC